MTVTRRTFLLGATATFAALPDAASAQTSMETFDIVIVGGTPGGICAAVAAARMGSRVLILERTAHIGGLPANGLGATDIATRGATSGLFGEFVRRVKEQYVKKYGADSKQVKDCSDGYHFEPSVAEFVYEAMLKEQANITVRRMRQFDADPANVVLDGSRLTRIMITNRETSAKETYTADVFLDATYEGDLAAAAGCPFETRREGVKEYGEPFAGRLYRPWGTAPLGEGSTGEGDDTLQAYNYRLCLTDVVENRLPIARPMTYNRAEFASLADDVKRGYLKHFMPPRFLGKDGADVGVVNPVRVPNGKTDTNNHHRSFLSTDLPEENWTYPRENWAWRDRFADRLRDYTLGLLYFCQNDSELPEAFREEAKRWGLSKDEYTDNSGFPRQMYVREGRRITGEYLFTALDAMAPEDIPNAYKIMAGEMPGTKGNRAPVKSDSITASHYAIDSHAVRKREPNRVHLDGFLGLSLVTKPYQVPYGVIVPKKVDGLLIPVPVSATHLGFGTLRMEPCWMAMGHAAGVAAHLSHTEKVAVRRLNIDKLQNALLEQKQVLIYLSDVPQNHPQWKALQRAGCHGCFPLLTAKPNDPINAATARDWAMRAKVSDVPAFEEGKTTRAEYAARLFSS